LQEQQSADCGTKAEMKKKNKQPNKKKKKKSKKKKDKRVEDIISEVRKPSNEETDTEEEDFWMPPAGERWDNDDGGDRWCSDSESNSDSDLEHEAEEGDVIGMYTLNTFSLNSNEFNVKITCTFNTIA
jgi:hypothetical protein